MRYALLLMLFALPLHAEEIVLPPLITIEQETMPLSDVRSMMKKMEEFREREQERFDNRLRELFLQNQELQRKIDTITHRRECA